MELFMTYCVLCQKRTRLNCLTNEDRNIPCILRQAFGDIDLSDRDKEFICSECAFILKSLTMYLSDLREVFKGYTKINIPKHFKCLKRCLSMINEDYIYSNEGHKSAMNGSASVPPKYHQHNSPEFVADNAAESSDDSNNQSETDMEISRINKKSQRRRKRKRNTRSKSAVSVTTRKSTYTPRRSRTRNSLRSANTPASIRYFTRSVADSFLCDVSKCYSRYKTFDELAEHVHEDHNNYDKYWESTYDNIVKMEHDELMQKYDNNPPPRYLEYKYPCVLQYCSNSFINIDDLATHKIEKHSLLITFSCRECYSQGYTSRKDFDNHYTLTHKRMQEKISAIHKLCILEDEAEKN